MTTATTTAALARTGRPRTWALTGAAYLAINGLALALVVREAEYRWFIWMTPMILYYYLTLGSQWSAKPQVME